MTLPTQLTLEEIMRFLPHRYPFLLVDRILEVKARGIHQRFEKRHL